MSMLYDEYNACSLFSSYIISLDIWLSEILIHVYLHELKIIQINQVKFQTFDIQFLVINEIFCSLPFTKKQQ